MQYKDYEGPIENLVAQHLDQIAHDHRVRIILAVESGSRAWGFASPASDYDVRFVYVRTRSEYFSLAPYKDYIEGIQDETLDINGWDLSKLLQQIHRANPSVYEWLNSTAVYRNDATMDAVREVARSYFARKPFLYHYYGTAKNHYEQYLRQDDVKYKKYFYVLRPILACDWIEAQKCPPPVPFQDLLDALVDGELRRDIEELRARKTTMTESETGPAFPSVHAFIERRLDHYAEIIPTLPDDRNPSWDAIDAVFRQCIE